MARKSASSQSCGQAMSSVASTAALRRCPFGVKTIQKGIGMSWWSVGEMLVEQATNNQSVVRYFMETNVVLTKI